MFFILKCHGRGESGLGLCTTEGMQSQKGLKHEEFFATQPNKKNSPGRMAQTPQTGSNDSVGRSCRYGCSILLKCDSHLAIFGTSLIKLLPPLDKFGLLSTPKETYNLNLSAVILRIWSFGTPTTMFCSKELHNHGLLPSPHTTSGLAKTLPPPLRGGDLRQFWRPNTFFNWGSALRSRIVFQVPKLCTNLHRTLIYILMLGTCSKFVRKN